jgi:hypothetical protein
MEANLIKCPQCGHEFGLSDALTGKMREHLELELGKVIAKREADLAKKTAALKEESAELARSKQALDEQVEEQLKRRLDEVEKKAIRKVEGQFTDQLKELEEALKERDSALEEFRQQEVQLRKKQREIDERRASLELEAARTLEAEREKLREEASRKTAAAMEGQLKELQLENSEKEERIRRFQEQEMALRKQQRDLEAAKEEAELELARRLDEERNKIRQEAARKADEEHRLKVLEKDRKIDQLNQLLQEAQRKVTQGSVQNQGEVLEEDFEFRLRRFFPHDDVQPVPKGVSGADLIQIVRTSLGAECGRILWEIKNTKSWSNQWIPKLKDDMRTTRSALGILLSMAMPDGIARFGQMDGVWVTDTLCAVPLAAALRQQLIAVDRERSAAEGKSEKMAMLYQYLAGAEFKQKIEGIVEGFTAMQDQLNQERRAMERQWNQREKHLERVIKNTVGLYGDMQGIIGGQIASIPALELDGGRNRVLREAPPPPAPPALPATRSPLAVDKTPSTENDAGTSAAVRAVIEDELQVYRGCAFGDLVRLITEGPEEIEREDREGGTPYKGTATAAWHVEGQSVRVTIAIVSGPGLPGPARGSFIMNMDGTVSGGQQIGGQQR